MRTARGFSLWELLCALGIAAITATLALPGFNSFLLDARQTADINALVLAVQLARSEAAKRGRPVTVCSTADEQTCGGETDYATGWMVFVNLDDRQPPQRAPAEPVLFLHRTETRGRVTANRSAFEFRPYWRRSTNGTVTFCDERGNDSARAVIVSYTGRPRVDSVDGDRRPLRCAGLP
jgi:type IV fimbrial biogenesis protein FimT